MKKVDVKSIKDLEKYFKNKPSIKLEKNYTRKPMRKTLYKAIMGDNRPKTIRPKQGTVQCKRNKYRSIYDLILLIRYYYPEDSIVTILKGVVNEYNNKKTTFHKSMAWCPNVQRSNFRGPAPASLCLRIFYLDSFAYQGFPSFRTNFKDLMSNE